MRSENIIFVQHCIVVVTTLLQELPFTDIFKVSLFLLLYSDEAMTFWLYGKMLQLDYDVLKMRSRPLYLLYSIASAFR